MKSRNRFAFFVMGGIILCTLIRCNPKTEVKQTALTPADSLTEMYLLLQDSLHNTWNMMLNDDNQKIKAMKALLHELKIGTPYSPEKIESYNSRIDQLVRIRYTLKTMRNVDVVEEYDFASASLVTELITMAESISSFAYNTTVQQLVEDIRAADMRVENYRADYDSVALTYNRFLEQHAPTLKETADINTPTKKALFSLTGE
jgi:hypothetical protein